MARLLISAAHTMENPGAIFQDLREADLTRKLLALCLPHLDLKKIEYKAVPLDLPLLQRIEWINNSGYSESNGDIFVELHINDGGKRGIEGWYRGNADVNNRSQRLTQTIVDYICKTAGYQNQGSKSEYEHELTSLLILNSTNPTGTCIESLYLDNAEDIAILKDDNKMNDLAKAIVEGIELFIKEDANRPKVEVQSQNPNTNEVTQQQTNTLNPQAGGSFQNPPMNIPQPVNPSPQGFPNPAPFNPPTPSFGGFGGGMQTPSFGGLGNKPAGNNGMLMDREQRKEMIKKTYLKIMGKEISQNDLNYYLNLGSSEDELVKKLIEHADFQAMIKDSVEAKELRLKVQKLEGEVALLQSNMQDTKALQSSLSQLLEQKNIMIQRLYQELQNHKIILEGQHIDSVKPKALSQSEAKNKQKEKISRKLFRRMMKVAKV